MKRAALLLTGALSGLFALTACHSEPDVQARSASVEEVANKVAKAGGTDSFVRPGKWQSQVQIEAFELPGAPPEAASAMRSMQHRAQVYESCLTPEQAKRPKEDFFAGANKNCRYEHFNMGGGKIDAVMRCADKGMAQTMAMQGTYGPDNYQMAMSMKAQGGPTPSDGMTMKMRIEAKRVGECDAKKAKAA
ncbi:MAG: DUF3617 domain-containing protein [Sphingomicrobium sp.]